MKWGIPPEEIWFFATGMITDTTQSKLASPKNRPRMRLASVPTYFDVFVRALQARNYQETVTKLAFSKVSVREYCMGSITLRIYWEMFQLSAVCLSFPIKLSGLDGRLQHLLLRMWMKSSHYYHTHWVIKEWPSVRSRTTHLDGTRIIRVLGVVIDICAWTAWANTSVLPSIQKSYTIVSPT